MDRDRKASEAYHLKNAVGSLLAFVCSAFITFGLILLSVQLPRFFPEIAGSRYALLIIAGATTIATLKAYARSLDGGTRVARHALVIHIFASTFALCILSYGVSLVRSPRSGDESTSLGILQVSIIIAAMAFIAIIKALLTPNDEKTF